VIRGDLGVSLTRGRPVMDIIAYDLPWTVFVLSIAICLSFTLGILLGTFMAYKGGRIDSISSTFLTIVSSIPQYIVGILLIVIFIFELRWFPTGGRYSLGVRPGFTWEFISDVLWHATLPILTYTIVSTGSWAITMRGSVTSVLGEDYVLAAEARGLRKGRIMKKYVMRNAILPLFTQLLITIGYMFAGAVFIENIFAYAGIGYTLLWALNNRDYPLLQGIFSIITFSVIAANLFTDLIYGKLDPRVRAR